MSGSQLKVLMETSPGFIRTFLLFSHAGFSGADDGLGAVGDLEFVQFDAVHVQQA